MDINQALFKFIKGALSVLLVLLIIYGTVTICRFGFDFGYRVFNEPPMAEAPGEDIMISIEEGMSSKELGTMLEQKGLIRDGGLFSVQLSLSAYKNDMMPGIYTLNTSMTAKDMMVKISEIYHAKLEAEEAAKKEQEKAQQNTQSTESTESTQNTQQETGTENDH